jgi:hypothetical protein
MTKEIADWSVSQRTMGPSSTVHIKSLTCANVIGNEEHPWCVRFNTQKGRVAFQPNHRCRSSLGEPVKRMVAEVERGEQEASGGKKPTYVSSEEATSINGYGGLNLASKSASDDASRSKGKKEDAGISTLVALS